jgi:hypothetical protein
MHAEGTLKTLLIQEFQSRPTFFVGGPNGIDSHAQLLDPDSREIVGEIWLDSPDLALWNGREVLCLAVISNLSVECYFLVVESVQGEHQNIYRRIGMGMSRTNAKDKTYDWKLGTPKVSITII